MIYRKLRNMKKILLSLLLITSPCLAEVRVVDGDSLEINNTRIRIDGIDAPEFFQTCQDANGKNYDCGQEAKQHLQDLIGEHKVDCNCLPKPDRYNRQICECFADETSLNRQMVADGYARVYRSEKYVADEENAEHEHLGIWQGKHMRPALYRILHQNERKKR